MGNCCGRRSKKQQDQDRREQGWRSTGVVGLRDCQLAELPKSLEGLAEGVRVIDATNNRLTVLPEYLGDFGALQRLILTGNRLSSIPASVCGLKNLRVLVLDDNRLSELPRAIGCLVKLERLSIAKNSLVEVPVTVGLLRDVKYMSLAGNKLTSLPEELGDCRQLEELDVSNNVLSALPGSMGQLTRLVVLTADDNQISSLPPDMLPQCTSLKTLTLYQNPISITVLQASLHPLLPHCGCGKLRGIPAPTAKLVEPYV